MPDVGVRGVVPLATSSGLTQVPGALVRDRVIVPGRQARATVH